ncbi:MAG: hypothetical protein ABI759_25510 [Candidatus Solibacter sp.]
MLDEGYQFDAEDQALLLAAGNLLQKVAAADTTSSAEMVSVAKLQEALAMLPDVAPEIEVSVSVSSPRRHFGEIETWHWWDVAVEGERVSISSGGHFDQPSTGGDTFSTMRWEAIPEEPAELEDHRESLWMVPDVLSFPDGVASIDFAAGGYTVEVSDEDNPLLEDDGDAGEEELEDEPAPQPVVVIDTLPAKSPGRDCFERIVRARVFTRREVMDFAGVPADRLDSWLTDKLIDIRREPALGSAPANWSLYEFLQVKILEVFCDDGNVRAESVNIAASAAANLIVNDVFGLGVFVDHQDATYQPDFGRGQFVISGPNHPIMPADGTTLWDIRHALVSSTWTALDMSLIWQGVTAPAIRRFVDRVKTIADLHRIDPEHVYREMLEGFDSGTYFALGKLASAVGHNID